MYLGLYWICFALYVRKYARILLDSLSASHIKMKARIVHVKERDETIPKHEGSFIGRKFEEFCKRTDLHGYKYIVMKDLTLMERSCWAVSVLISILAAAYFVYTAYYWFARSPIATVIESTHGAIWDVPFPAITICDVNQISKKQADKLSKNLKLPDNITKEEIYETIRLTPLLHGETTRASPDQKKKLITLQAVLELNNFSMVQLFTTLSRGMSCNELVERCMWKNTVYRCELLFQRILIQFGVCCTFNFYAVKLVDNGIFNGTPSRSELFRPSAPRRVASCGYQTALTVLLNNDPDDYYSASVASYGMLVLIDNAYDFPSQDTITRLVSPGLEMFIALAPEKTYATAGIKSFSIEKRQCFYSDEFSLGAFNQYTYHNCMMYRSVELVRKSCQCVPYYFPTPKTDTYRKCNFSDIDCLEMVMKPLDRFESEYPSADEVTCLPDCHHYDYPLEVAFGVLAKEVPLDGLAFFKDVDLVNKSLLNVFFSDLVSTKYRRDVYLNWQNLLTSFGGLLSLMLGFTLISVIDFVIFFTFRLAYDAMTPVVHQEGAKAHQPSKGWKQSNQIYAQEHRKKDNWVRDESSAGKY